MEPTATTTIWDSVTTVITNLTNLMGTMSTTLLSNQIFQIVIGIIMFSLAMGYVFTLVRKLRTRGR